MKIWSGHRKNLLLGLMLGLVMGAEFLYIGFGINRYVECRRFVAEFAKVRLMDPKTEVMAKLGEGYQIESEGEVEAWLRDFSVEARAKVASIIVYSWPPGELSMQVLFDSEDRVVFVRTKGFRL